MATGSHDPQQREELRDYDAARLLSGIHLYRVHDAAELLAAVRALKQFVADRKAVGGAVRLVVVDSVAMHFRHGPYEHARRLQMLGQVTQTLTELAADAQLAVVLVNQVTTRVHEATNTSTLVPALGESWAHACNIQLMLEWDHGVRVPPV